MMKSYNTTPNPQSVAERSWKRQQERGRWDQFCEFKLYWNGQAPCLMEKCLEEH